MCKQLYIYWHVLNVDGQKAQLAPKVVVVSNALDIHDDSMTAAIDYIFEMASIKDKYVHKLIYLIVVMPYFNRHPYWLRYAS